MTPIIRLRVVCGLGEVMATLAPTSWLTRVDFPTLGGPTTVTKADRITLIPKFLYSFELQLVHLGPEILQTYTLNQDEGEKKKKCDHANL